MTDFTVSNHGTILILRPITKEAKVWVDLNIPDDAQWFGHGVVVEHRYIGPILAGIEDDGLTYS